MPAGLDGNSDPIVTEARSAVIRRAANLILERKRSEIPLLVGIDGIDGSGKSTLRLVDTARLGDTSGSEGPISDKQKLCASE